MKCPLTNFLQGNLVNAEFYRLHADCSSHPVMSNHIFYVSAYPQVHTDTYKFVGRHVHIHAKVEI